LFSGLLAVTIDERQLIAGATQTAAGALVLVGFAPVCEWQCASGSGDYHLVGVPAPVAIGFTGSSDH